MLSSVEDPRSKYGRRHSLENMLIMCIMAMMSGYNGYREIGRFLKKHQKEIRQSLCFYHQVPSYVTIRDVMQRIDFDKLSKSFNRWAEQYVPMCKGDTKSVDGKAIGGTVSNCFSSYQNFTSLVSVFASQRGIVLSCSKNENKKSSEIPTVRQLIETLDVKGDIFTMDAIHCQKKH